MVDLKRTTAVCGVIAPTVALVAIFASTALTPSFSWTGTSLSRVGRQGKPAAALFNLGLVVGGVVGLPFVWRSWVESGGAW